MVIVRSRYNDAARADPSKEQGEYQMYEGKAKIILENRDARRVVASAARISTTEGSALELFEQPGDAARDLKLVQKVLASGHKSIMEHQTFSIAFDRVSVLVEQFMIEHRLASYIVKSRRYVDFSGAGYLVPDDLPDEARALYVQKTDELFQLYRDLTDAGVPREDARFILPYSFSSNFYVTLNARELIAIVSEMLYGRGADQPEIAALGAQLEEQFDALYPGVIASERVRYARCAVRPAPAEIKPGGEARGSASLVAATPDPQKALSRAIEFAGRFPPDDGDYASERNMMALVKDARPRELECLTAQFLVRDISLACVTHFTRHRMLSLMVPDAVNALANGNYVVPESVKKNAALLARYEAAFAQQAALATQMRRCGMPAHDMAYLALSGHVTDILLSMNARELLHFMKLRTCNRAQWEIRRVARAMLDALMVYDEDIFWVFGPSCYVDGKCPEGRLSCGKPTKM